MASQVTELAERTQSVGTRRRSLKRWGPAVTLPALLLAITFGLLAQVAPARAATLDVCPGTGTYTTIQAAVDAAAAGDVIQICAGTYNESVDLPDVGRDITLEGVGMVVISPTTGAAIFADNGPYAGNITLINLDARSVRFICTAVCFRNCRQPGHQREQRLRCELFGPVREFNYGSRSGSPIRCLRTTSGRGPI